MPVNDSADSSPNSARPAPRVDAAALAAKLRALRARDGITQEQVAQRLNCHESAVSRWEGGSRLPRLSDLVGLSALYSVSLDELLDRDRQFAAPGAALVDLTLLSELAAAASVDEFDARIERHAAQAVWLPVPDGAALMPVNDAMRLAREVAEKFAGSRYADRLFRPRG